MRTRLTFLLSLSATLGLLAQDLPIPSPKEPLVYSSHSLFIGTQIPLQYSAGYAYRFSNHFSARLQAGVLTKPYDRFIRSSMEAFGLEKELSRVIAKSFRGGTLLGLGGNYHFSKNYTGIYGQYLHLRSGGITPADALGVYFKRDFSGFDPQGLPAFEFSMQSDLYQIGALYGRQFQLPHPRWRIDAEVSLAKVIGSSSTFASNRSVVDRTGIAKGLYRTLNQEVGQAYQQHGWLPTINLYLVYQLR